MISVFLIFLFLLQIISFYLIVLLFTKLSKFKSLEKKQEILMKEMDDAVSAYLAEIKDENNRLIKELSNQKLSSTTIEKKEQFVEKSQRQDANQNDFSTTMKQIVPKSIVVNTYKNIEKKTKPTPLPKSNEEKALELHHSGYSIEQIAKQLNLGTTEVELILKFRM